VAVNGACRKARWQRRRPFLPGQCLGLEPALAAYTSGSAGVNGLESAVGAIRPGLDADFAVVDADLSVLPPGELCQASVRQTWIGGRLAYEGHGTATHQRRSR
jgi:predicted amidohydrolase YtcJ